MNAPVARIGLWLALAHMLAFADRAKIAGLLPLMRNDISMSDTLAGWVLGAALTVGYAATLIVLACLPRGSLGDAGRRISLGIAIGTAASLATALVQTTGQLLVARAVLGAGQALFIPAAITLLVDPRFPLAMRTWQLARFLAAASLGRGGGLLAVAGAIGLVGWLAIAGTPWRWVFALTVLPNLALLAVLRRLRHGPPAPAADRQRATALPPTRVRTAYLLLAVAPFVLIQAFVGWLPTLLARSGLGVAAAATIVGLQTVVAGVGGQLLGGAGMRRFGTRPAAAPIAIVAGLVAAGLLIAGGVASGRIAMLLATFLPAHFIMATTLFATIFGWQQLLPPDCSLTGNGTLMGIVTFVGVGLGPVLAGAIADVSGDLGIALTMTALGCAAWTMVAGAVVLALYRRYRVSGATR